MTVLLHSYKNICPLTSGLRTAMKRKGMLVYVQGRDRLPKYYRPEFIIRIGNPSNAPEVAHLKRIINSPSATALAVNKLKTFVAWRDTSLEKPRFVPFTTEADVANEWLTNGSVVLERRELGGHSGSGIVLHSGGVLPSASRTSKLFTQYVKKFAEYRVHVFDGLVIDFQQKKKRAGSPPTNMQIRTYANGWVFTRDGVTPPEDVLRQAKLAVASLGLDFGAVDVLWNKKNQQAFVCEVNTAPAVEGHTLERYTNAVINLLETTRGS